MLQRAWRKKRNLRTLANFSLLRLDLARGWGRGGSPAGGRNAFSLSLSRLSVGCWLVKLNFPSSHPLVKARVCLCVLSSPAPPLAKSCSVPVPCPSNVLAKDGKFAPLFCV